MMKNYRVIVTSKSGLELVNKNELSNSIKHLEKKYKLAYQFHPVKVRVQVFRLVRKPGIQLGLYD